MSQRTNASSALPNTEQSWDAHWRRDGRAALEELGVSQVMDQIKFNYLMPFLPQHGLFVEFGCGSARLARFIIRRGLRGIGLDRSHEALLVAQKASRQQDSGMPVGLIRADVLACPLPSAAVDVVASTGLLEHFSDPWPVMQEMVRVLKPGGLFYSDIVPAKFSLYRCLDWLRIHQVEIFERRFSQPEIEGLMMRAGLSEVRVFGAGVFPPRLPLLERSAFVRKVIASLTMATLPFWRALDGTWFAALAGFYFFAVGRKSSVKSTEGP